ncbi:MAG: amino acid adenylation domain-containing protein, partial [Halanaerobiales bacterium]|nr:amino acid adenylation domain-containing protein [Halanaerobiales bacterium]
KIVLTQSHLYELVNCDTKIVNLSNDEIFTADNTNLENVNKSTDLAYVIYTSGSTGKPKGVMVEHKSLLNLTWWHIDYYSVTSLDQSTKYAGFSFDASVCEIFPYILKGATIHIIYDEIRLDMQKLNDYYEANNITISFLPTQICEQIMLLNNQSLRILNTGGDKLKSYNPQRYRCINNYGPSEGTVASTCYEVTENLDNIPIGKPISNTQVYILDKNNALQLMGVPGELCISGDNLARGYLNRPELTAEKFILNPFMQNGERIYRTGDLARWLPDGNIEFLGRIDHQVKIRGFRIELGEIENQLLKHDQVKETVVIERMDHNNYQYLCAYIVSDVELSVSELQAYLSKELPEYMIPSYFVRLDKIPLTSNGKINRKALLEQAIEVNTGEGYVAPTNEIEKKLVDIWSEILGIDRIGIHDSFFELGGHSLKAMQVISKISKEMNVELPLREIFKTPTIKELAEYICLSEKKAYYAIEKLQENANGYYPVSSAQKRMFIVNQFEVNSTNYNMPGAMFIESDVDFERLEELFKALVKRHEPFRTSFEMIDGKVVQRIYHDLEFKLEYLKADENKVQEAVNEFVKPFDLSKAPLLRVGFVKVGEKHLLLFDMHHIISDGVSMDILIKEFINLHFGRELPELIVQYKDFAAWQNKFFESEEMKKQEVYWLETFKQGTIPVLNMPIDVPKRPAVMSFEGDKVSFTLPEELIQGLRELATEHNGTLFMILLAAYNILLSKYTGQDDIIIGTPIAGRPHPDLDNLIGMFVNTLAMRNYPYMDNSFVEFFTEVKENTLKAFENQDFQFEMLVEKLDLQRDLSRNPLFDTMFTLQNFAGQSDDNRESKLIANFSNKVAKFDLSLTMVERKDQIQGSFEYSTKLFKKSTMERLVKHFVNIVTAIVENPKRPIAEIEMLTHEERLKILTEFNDTQVEYPVDKTLNQLFEEQAQRTPDQIALVFEDKKMTYQELSEKSNRLAKLLRKKGVGRDQIVGMILEPSFEMVIGIFAILKAGGAYLPIDPGYPAERIGYILADSKPKMILTQSTFLSEIQFAGELVNLDDSNLYLNNLDNCGTVSTENVNHSNDLAYIIYTSGTTGRPKGVMVEHQSVVNLVNWYNVNYLVNEHQNVLQMTTYTFDPAVEQIFGTLCHGSTLHLIINEVKLNKELFRKYIEEHQISIIDMVPSAMKELLIDEERIERIRVVISGGEKLDDYLKDQLINLGYNVYNHYGLTETTVEALVSKCSADKVVLGRPVSNTKCYILDKQNHLVPIGVVGEICIAGDCLARGYLNKEELTKERFISISLNGHEERIYKAGDLGRWLPDGTVEFVGRIDSQVKIRGFRIELAEIEHHLFSYDGINDTVVIDHEDNEGNRYLCAYVVADSDVVVSDIRSFLAEELPNYMIPSYFVQLEKLPLTSNEKIDRKALLKPDGEIVRAEYVAPSNEIEEKFVSIWAEILRIQKVGVTDNFFEIGGHSLKATSMITKVYKEFTINLPLREIFRTPTVRELAGYIQNVEGGISYPKDDNLVLLRRGTENLNLFFVHGGDGEVEGYVDLAERLNPEFNCWGIRADRLNGYAPKNVTVEEMADRYIGKIRMIQEVGPYYIAGWSLGGTIVFEMVRQLEQMDEKVQFCGIIDSVPPRKGQKVGKFTLESEIKLVEKLVGDGEIGEKLKDVSSINEVWALVVEYIEKMDLDIDVIRRLIPNNLAKVIPNYDQLSIGELIYYNNVIRTLDNAQAIYSPSDKIQALINFFKADKTPINLAEWESLCLNPIKVYNIPGDHHSILKSPDVVQLSERFIAIFNESVIK